MVRIILGLLVFSFGFYGFMDEHRIYSAVGHWDNKGLILATVFVAIGGSLLYFGVQSIAKRRAQKA